MNRKNNNYVYFSVPVLLLIATDLGFVSPVCGDDGEFLAFTVNGKITTLSFGGNSFEKFSSLTIPNTTDKIEVDYKSEKLFYSSDGAIKSIFFNNTADSILVPNQNNVLKLYFDAPNNHLYWLEKSNKRTYFLRRKNLNDPLGSWEEIWELGNDNNVREIAVDPVESRVYWTNDAMEQPSVQRAFTCTPSKIQSIITHRIQKPTGLTLDHIHRKLYWADTQKHKIEKCDYDGTNRQIIVRAPQQEPDRLAILGQHVFYTDLKTHSIFRVNKDTELGTSQFIKKYNKTIRAIIPLSSYTNISMEASHFRFPDGLPPVTVTETRHSYQNVSLRYLNENIAVYLDADNGAQNSIKWPTKLLSDAWQYVQSTYGPFASNRSRLYVILHQEPLYCPAGEQNLKIQNNFEKQNLIDLSPADGDGWTQNTTANYQALLTPFANLIQLKADGFPTSTHYRLCQESLKNILFYDIYLHLVGHTDAIATWRTTKEADTCFRDWHLRIYENNGGTSALLKYFAFTAQFLSQRESTSTSKLNLEEFVHIWSIAAGVNLVNLARKALNWTGELKTPSNNYTFTYPDSNDKKLDPISPTNKIKWKGQRFEQSITFVKPVVVFSFQDIEVYSPPIFQHLHDAWKYCRDHYGILGNDTVLNLFLQTKIDEESEEPCNISNPKPVNEKDPAIVINCSASVPSKWRTDAPNQLSRLFQKMSRVQLELIKWPNTWPAKNVSGWSMESIVVYDIYKHLGLEQGASVWKNEKMDEQENMPRDEIYWFKNWYYFIYDHYGETDVLRKLFALLKSDWSVKGKKGRSDLNMGEYVHFWSAAASKNLLDIAKSFLNWNPEYQTQFTEARKALPGLSYSCVM